MGHRRLWNSFVRWTRKDSFDYQEEEDDSSCSESDRE